MSKTMVTVACLGVLSSRPSSFAQAPWTAGAETAPVECTIKDAVEDAACRTRLKGLFARKAETLALMLEGGKSKAYRGNRAACDGDDSETCVGCNLLRYFPAIDESDPPKLEFRYKAKQNENGRWRGGTPMTG